MTSYLPMENIKMNNVEVKDRLRWVGMLYEQIEQDIHDHEVDALHDLLWHIPEEAIFEYFEADREENDNG